MYPLRAPLGRVTIHPGLSEKIANNACYTSVVENGAPFQKLSTVLQVFKTRVVTLHQIIG